MSVRDADLQSKVRGGLRQFAMSSVPPRRHCNSRGRDPLMLARFMAASGTGVSGWEHM